MVIVALAGRPSSSPPALSTPITSQITYASAPRRLWAADHPFVLHRLGYRAPGGPVTIRWYDSDFESTGPRQVSIVWLSIDGRRVASTAKSALTGTFEDGQGDLVWRGQLARGPHIIRVVADDAAKWGFPYVDTGLHGTDELIVIRGGSRAA